MWEPPAVSTVIVSFDPSTLLDKLFLAHCKTVHDRLSIDFIYFTAKVSQLHHVNIRARHAALILADDGVDITADNLKKLTTAANIDKVDAIFPVLHAKAFERKDVKGTMAEINAGNGADLHPAACMYPDDYSQKCMR
jgi:ribosomal protein L12E/L44/L45/RPP1/RPP2